MLKGWSAIQKLLEQGEKGADRDAIKLNMDIVQALSGEDRAFQGCKLGQQGWAEAMVIWHWVLAGSKLN